MRMILEDMDVKVFRSHVKIPMIFLVPALFVVSLYVLVYLVANSLFFQAQLQAQVNAFFPGTMQVAELVISPTFQSIGLHRGGFQDTRGEPILTVERIDLKLNLSSLLLRRLKVTSAKLHGVDLKLVIDPDTSRLNLLDGLFLLTTAEPAEPSEPLDFTFDFTGISFERSRFRFVHNDFEFEVPRVEIPQGEVHVTPETVLINVPSWRVATADFRFRHSMFGNVPDVGDWTFSIRDFDLREFDWVNMGYTVEKLTADVEGYKLDLRGQMAFPEDEFMTYDIHGQASAPYQSTLLEYFLEDLARFELPELTAHVKGTYDHINGTASLFAEHVMAADVFLSNVSADLTLENAMVLFSKAHAEIHGGTVDVDSGFYHIFEKKYGATFSFEDVNPNGILADLGKDRSYLEGAVTGRAELTGEVPRSIPFAYFNARDIWEHTTDRYADVRLLEDAVYTRSNNELFPNRSFRIQKGARVWVTVDSVVIDEAFARSGPDRFTLRDLWFNWQNFDYEPLLDPRGVYLHAELADVAPYMKYYGVEGVTSGPTSVTLRAHGPMFAPEIEMTARVREPRFENKFQATALETRLAVRGGRLDLQDLSLTTARGRAQMKGTVELLRVPDAPRTALEYVARRTMKARLDATLKNAELGILRPFLPASLRALEGRVSADVNIRNTLQRPVACVDGEVDDLRLWGEHIDHVEIDATYRARGTRRGCAPGDVLEDKLEVARVDVERALVDLGQGGKVVGRGRYGLDESFTFDLDAQGVDLGELKSLRGLSANLDGRGDARLRGSGTLEKPDIGGSVRLRDLRVAVPGITDRALELGDASLVVNTLRETFDGIDGEDAIEYRSIRLVGALRPWFTLDVTIPVEDNASVDARIGLDRFDVLAWMRRTSLMRAIPSLSTLARLDTFEVTGGIELGYELATGNYSVIAKLPAFALGPRTARVVNDGDIEIGYTSAKTALGVEERVQIEKLRLGLDSRFIDIRGSVLPREEFFDLNIQGVLDLGVATLLRVLAPDVLPESLASASGAVEVDASIRGSASKPLLDGFLRWGANTTASLMFRTFPDPILIRDGEVRFQADQLTISERTPLKGIALGGAYEVVGDIQLVDFLPKRADLKMWSTNMSYAVADMLNMTFGTGDKLRGQDKRMVLRASDLLDYSTWSVSGTLVLLDGLYYENISFLEKQLTGRVLGAFNRQAEVFESSFLERYPEFREMELALDVQARDSVRLKNRVDRFDLDLEFRIALAVAGTLEDMSLAGDVEVIDGTVIFQGESFTVQDGIVRFSGEPGNPFIDVRAGADIRNTCKGDGLNQDVNQTLGLSTATTFSENNQDDTTYHIVLNVKGTPESLELLYEATPYADQRDVISLILTGCTVDLLTASSASQPTLEIALGPLLGQLERQIQDVVKVDEFSIIPGLERTQLRIGDKLFQRLSWGFQLDAGFNNASMGTVVLGYEFTDRLSIKLSGSQQNLNNSFNTFFDLKLNYSIPLD